MKSLHSKTLKNTCKNGTANFGRAVIFCNYPLLGLSPENLYLGPFGKLIYIELEAFPAVLVERVRFIPTFPSNADVDLRVVTVSALFERAGDRRVSIE